MYIYVKVFNVIIKAIYIDLIIFLNYLSKYNEIS